MAKKVLHYNPFNILLKTSFPKTKFFNNIITLYKLLYFRFADFVKHKLTEQHRIKLALNYLLVYIFS